MYSNTLVHLELLRIWREDFLLSSMATVVDLSKGNLYKLLVLVMSLFVWCMSGALHVFDDKTYTRDELICLVCHVWLIVN